MALALARLLRETMEGEKGPAQRKAVVEITRELARWRRQNHQMKRLRHEEGLWEQERVDKHNAEMEAMREGIKDAKLRTQVFGDMFRKEYCDGLADGTLDPARAASIREFFATKAKRLRECGVSDLPSNGQESPSPPAKSEANPTESK